MWFDVVFERFVEKSPCCVMLRGTMEHLFADSFLDSVFEQTAQVQYQKELAFSTVAALLSEVVLRVRPSLRNAYRERQGLPATLKSVYEKLKNTEPAVCEALLSQTAQRCADLLTQLPGSAATDPIAGLHLRIVDGNFLAGTDHRPLPLRGSGAAALPGMSVVLRDDRTGLLCQLLCREDAYSSERSLLDDVLAWVKADDLILGDRNYCTLKFLKGIANRLGFYLIRHHQQLHLRDKTRLRLLGKTDRGKVYEKRVWLGEADDAPLCRCIVVKLDKPTRDGETEVVLLSNVSKKKAKAIQLAELYLRRWRIEHSFQVLTDYLRCEVDTLAYPKAALLGFSLAVCAYNVMAVLQGALAAEVGKEKVEQELSAYEVAEEVAQDYSGLQIALPEQFWERFAQMSSAEMASWLRQIARRLRWERYRKRKPTVKKPVVVQSTQRGAHRCTARELAEARANRAKASSEKPSPSRC